MWITCFIFFYFLPIVTHFTFFNSFLRSHIVFCTFFQWCFHCAGNANTLVFLLCSHARFSSPIFFPSLFSFRRYSKTNVFICCGDDMKERWWKKKLRSSCSWHSSRIKSKYFFHRRRRCLLKFFQPYLFTFSSSFVSFVDQVGLSGRSWEIKCGKYRSFVVCHNNPLYVSATKPFQCAEERARNSGYAHLNGSAISSRSSQKNFLRFFFICVLCF